MTRVKERTTAKIAITLFFERDTSPGCVYKNKKKKKKKKEKNSFFSLSLSLSLPSLLNETNRRYDFPRDDDKFYIHPIILVNVRFKIRREKCGNEEITRRKRESREPG